VKEKSITVVSVSKIPTGCYHDWGAQVVRPARFKAANENRGAHGAAGGGGGREWCGGCN